MSKPQPPSSAPEQQRKGAQRRIPKPRRKGRAASEVASNVPVDVEKVEEEVEPSAAHVPPAESDRRELMNVLKKYSKD